MLTPDYQRDGVTLYCGDCLDVLHTLAVADAFVMDPPYCSGARKAAEKPGRGGMSRGARWAAKPMTCDAMTTVGFIWLLRHVAIHAERMLPDGGSLLSFIDWRQYPNAYGAIETANLRIQGVVVWDKMHFALGNGFRNQHEFILHASRGTPTIHDRAVPNVIQCKRIAASTIHPTEKPPALIVRLLPVVTCEGQQVCDPFMGSGTTGVACVQTGRRFIGIEKEPKYFEIAVKRIEAALADKAAELPFKETANGQDTASD